MRFLKPVDYKLKVHLMINTSSMRKFQLRKHNINLGLKSLSTISLWRPKSSMDRLSFLELLNLMDASIFSQKKESRQRTIS